MPGDGVRAASLLGQGLFPIFRTQSAVRAYGALGIAHLLSAEWHEARKSLRRCLALARVLLHAEMLDSDQVEEALRCAEQLISETRGRAFQPFVHEERANLARLRGDDAACERELREAHRLYTEMGAVGHAERVGREL